MVYIELFHGRKRGEVLDDWGVQGPVFKAEYFHTTYASEVKFDDKGYVLSVQGGTDDTINECLYYDGVWYGDWSVFGEGIYRKSVDLKARYQLFDPAKARLPIVNMEGA